MIHNTPKNRISIESEQSRCR